MDGTSTTHREGWRRVVQAVEERATQVATAPAVVYLTFALTTFTALLPRKHTAILRAFPFYWGAGPVSWWAVLFWSLVVTSMALAYLKERKARHDKQEERQLRAQQADAAREAERRHREDAAAAQQAITEAREESRRLNERISEEIAKSTVRLEKMPPKDLLGSFDGIFRSCYEVYMAAIGGYDRTRVADQGEPRTAGSVARSNTRRRSHSQRRMDAKHVHAVLGYIRTILFGATSLVQKFEDSPADVKFSANVMLFRPQALVQRASNGYVPRIRYHHVPNSADGLRGILDMQCALSVLIDGTRPIRVPIPDRALPQFAMPIPTMERSDDQGWLVLPGAPQAYCSGEMDVIRDVDDVLHRCDERYVHKHISRSLRAHLDHEVPHIQSFISVPLERLSIMGVDGDETTEAMRRVNRIGVLNINSSRVGVLQDKEMQELLLMLLRPILWMLADLIVEVDKPKHRSVLIAGSSAHADGLVAG